MLFMWGTGRVNQRAFLRSWGSPEQADQSSDQAVRAYRYARLWDLYQGEAFSDLELWADYRRKYGLYRRTRLIWDHVHSLVDFYSSHVYPGSLALDGLNLPDGVPNAIPLAKDTDKDLAGAIGQMWEWCNFQESKNLIVRYTAAVGELLVEIRDDPEKGRLSLDFIWPAYVHDIRLDDVGNVVSYVIQYSAYDKERKEHFTFRREVDKDYIRTFRNNVLHDYTQDKPGSVETGSSSDGLTTDDMFKDQIIAGGEVENPYGFVPAVWYRHIRTIGVRGEPAVWASMAELDEINSLLSHAIDKSHISLRAPIVVAGNIVPNQLKKALTDMVGAIKRPFTEDLDDIDNDRETLNVLQGPAGTDVSTIDINVDGVSVMLDRCVAGIERKCPEVTFYDQMRSMTQISGAAANRLLGDVDHRLRAIASGYDRQTTKITQMYIAIAGWRLAEGEGGWSEKTAAQQKFSKFNLESYAKGELEFNIMPRDLVPMTSMERIELAAAKKALLPMIPDEVIAAELGYHVDDFLKWKATYEAEQEELMQQEQDNQKELIDIKRPVGAPPGGPQQGAQTQNRRPPMNPGGSKGRETHASPRK